MEATLSHIKSQAASQASWSFSGFWNMEAPHCQRMSAAWHLSRPRGTTETTTQRRFMASLSSLRLEIHRVGGPVEEASLKGFSLILADSRNIGAKSGDIWRHDETWRLFTHVHTLFVHEKAESFQTKLPSNSASNFMSSKNSSAILLKVKCPLCQPKILQRHAKSSTGLTEYNAYGILQQKNGLNPGSKAALI